MFREVWVVNVHSLLLVPPSPWPSLFFYFSPLTFFEVDKGRVVDLGNCAPSFFQGPHEVGETSQHLGAAQVAQCKASLT